MTADSRNWGPKFIMSESPQGGKFDSNLGGMAIRYGEVSGVIGVFDAPDTPMRIGMQFGLRRPRARRCSGSWSAGRSSRAGGCASTGDSCWSENERGRGAGASLAKKGQDAVSSGANGGVLSPVGWVEKPDPHAGRA